jgi:hypothetical protein
MLDGAAAILLTAHGDTDSRKAPTPIPRSRPRRFAVDYGRGMPAGCRGGLGAAAQPSPAADAGD